MVCTCSENGNSVIEEKVEIENSISVCIETI